MFNLLLLICSMLLIILNHGPSSITVLRNSSTGIHLFLASSLIITLLAFVKGGINPLLPLHFLGLCCVALILDKKLALIACALSCIILVLAGKISFDTAGSTLLLGMIIPVLVVDKLRQFLGNKRNTQWRFIGLVVIGGSLLSMVTKTLLMGVYYVFIDNIPLTIIFNEYIVLSTLFWIPEIMLNATVILTMIQHKPHWVASYTPSVNASL